MSLGGKQSGATAGFGPALGVARAASIRGVLLYCFLPFFLLPATTALAAPPKIERMTPHGLQIGGTVRVVFEGEHLDASARLFLDGAPLAAVRVGAAAADRAEFDVPLPASASPGVFPLRVLTDEGLSGPEAVAVDALPQFPFPAAAERPAPLEKPAVALTGRIGGTAILRQPFLGKKGEWFTAEVDARRLGSKVSSVLNLYDAGDRLLATGEPSRLFGGDARLVHPLPADGSYTLEVHESSWSGEAPNHIRVRLGAFSAVDAIVPASAPAGTLWNGRLLGLRTPAEAILLGRPPFASTAGEPGAGGGFHGEVAPLPFPRGGLWTGRPPVVFRCDLPTAAFADPARSDLQNMSAAVVPPAALRSYFSRPGEVRAAWLRLPSGKPWRFEVLAQRAGAPLDPALRIDLPALAAGPASGGKGVPESKSAQAPPVPPVGPPGVEGKTSNAPPEEKTLLAEGDDSPGSLDPRVELPAADHERTVRVSVRDQLRRSGPAAAFELWVRPGDEPRLQSRFTVAEALLPQAGSAIVGVEVERNGFEGRIELHWVDPPPGIETLAAEVAPGETHAAAALRANSSTPRTLHHLTLLAVPVLPDGRPGRPVPVQVPGPTWLARTPWRLESLPVAVVRRTPIAVSTAVLAMETHPGGRIGLPIEVHRAPGFEAAVRISLWTDPSLLPKPGSKAKPAVRRADPAHPPKVPTPPVALTPPNLRLGAGFTAAGGALRFAPQTAVGTLRLVGLRVEALDADGETVLGTVDHPVGAFRVGEPVRLTLDAMETQIVRGRTGKDFLAGRIQRLSGFDGPVWISLEGLPEGIAAPNVVALAHENAFRLPLDLPPGPAAAKLPVKVAARVVLQGAPWKAPAISTTLAISAGSAAPPAAGAATLVQDAPAWAISNGGEAAGGTAVPEWRDRIAGRAALKILPPGLSRERLPQWNYVVRERPGPGEHRYLRFAWRKQGGESIALRLHAKPASETNFGELPPSFTYFAGPKDQAPPRAALLAGTAPSAWTVVTRDLFADFGACELRGLSLDVPDGDYALLDLAALAPTREMLSLPPRSEPPERPFTLLDDAWPKGAALEGADAAVWDKADKAVGAASLRVSSRHARAAAAHAWRLPIREEPGPGEYRFIRFAWKKQGGQAICLELLADDGPASPAADPSGGDPPGDVGERARPAFDSAAPDGGGVRRGYHAGPIPQCFGPSKAVSPRLPREWTVVTRDLFADFGEFTLTGMAFIAGDGESASFDHVLLGRRPADLETGP